MLGRRNFLGVMCLFPFIKKPKRKDSYIFNFRDKKPFTNHPRYKSILKRGVHNVVFLDGKKFESDFACLCTGENGWIAVSSYEVDEKYNPLFLVTEGNVVYKDSRIDKI